MIEFLIFCVCGAAFAFGCHFLGCYLRSRGYGPQLDALDRQFTAFQYRVNRTMLPAAGRFYSGFAAYKKNTPLFGSKADLVMIERIRMAIVAEQAQQGEEIRAESTKHDR